MRKLAYILLLCLALPLHAATQRGIGPFTLVAKRGTVTVRLLRRDASLVWVLQKSQTGEFIETGIAIKDIERFQIGRPKLFRMAEAAQTPEQMQKVAASLRKFISQLEPYRDLPGMVVDEAVMQLAALYEREERWPEALELYTELLDQPYTVEQAPEARLHAGLCQSQLRNFEAALANLDLEVLTDDDLDLLSSVYFARGEAFRALEQYDKALLSYLYLVVFHPFMNENEPRCLAAALPCYAAVSDWEAAFKTVDVLANQFKDTPYAAEAEAFAEQHGAQFAQEAGLQDTYDATAFEEDKGVYDDFE